MQLNITVDTAYASAYYTGMAKRNRAAKPKRYIVGVSFSEEQRRDLDLLARALSPQGVHLSRPAVIKYAIRKALEALQ